MFEKKKFSILLALTFCFSLSLRAQNYPDPIVKIPFPAGTLGWNADDTRFALGEDNIIFVRDFATSEITHTLPFRNIMLLSFTHEGGEDMILALSSDGKACIWDFARTDVSLALEHGISITQTPKYSLSVGSKNDRIVCAGISKKSNLIAVATSSGALSLYFKLRLTKSLVERSLVGHTQSCYSIKFSENENYIVSAAHDGTLIVHNVETEEIVSNLNFYSSTKVPVLFTQDSSFLISCADASTLTVRTFDGKIVQTIDAVRPIKDIALYSDGQTLIVLTDDDRLRFYDIPTGEYKKYIPSYNVTEITSFAVSSSGKYILVGHKDGSIYRLEVDGVMLEKEQKPPKLLTVDAENVVLEGQEHFSEGITEEQWNEYRKAYLKIVNGELVEKDKVPPEKNKKKKDADFLHTVDLGAVIGFLNEEETYYTTTAGLDAAWRTTKWTNPLYEGVGLRFLMGWPSDDFPSHYSTYDGTQNLEAPYLFMFDLYAPVGINLLVDNTILRVFVELDPALRVSFLMNPRVARSALQYSFVTRFNTGLAVKFITANIGLEYDSVWGFMPQAGISARIRFGKRGAA